MYLNKQDGEEEKVETNEQQLREAGLGSYNLSRN